MKTNQSNKNEKATHLKNNLKVFISAEPGLARTIGKMSLVLSIFGVVAEVPPLIFYSPYNTIILSMSFIFGCIGFGLSRRVFQSNRYAIAGIIISVSAVLLWLVLSVLFKSAFQIMGL